MRQQSRRDRLAQGQAGAACGETMSAFQLVLAQAPERAGNTEGATPPLPVAAMAPAASVGPDALPPASPLPAVRHALQQAHPGTRLLSDAERRSALDSLTRRQQEVVSQVESSQLKGEAGRAMLNLAQRELLDISRLRGAVSKRYVLVRTDPEAAKGVSELMDPGGTVAGVPVEEVAVIDELEPDDAEVDSDGDEGPNDTGASGGPSVPMGTTIRGGASVAWEIGSPSRQTQERAPQAPGRAHGAPGGIAFDVTLKAGPKATKPPARNMPPPEGERRAAVEPPRPPAPATPSASEMGSAAATLTVPAQLFGAGTPLSNKVQKLRSHLIDKLGGQGPFDKVYDYVSREESGEQQAGEREEILAFMASTGQRELLPLVHTLIYLEDALGTS
jgi:hypothetical protein